MGREPEENDGIIMDESMNRERMSCMLRDRLMVTAIGPFSGGSKQADMKGITSPDVMMSVSMSLSMTVLDSSVDVPVQSPVVIWSYTRLPSPLEG